jgi:hypothetical protein
MQGFTFQLITSLLKNSASNSLPFSPSHAKQQQANIFPRFTIYHHTWHKATNLQLTHKVLGYHMLETTINNLNSSVNQLIHELHASQTNNSSNFTKTHFQLNYMHEQLGPNQFWNLPLHKPYKYPLNSETKHQTNQLRKHIQIHRAK